MPYELTHLCSAYIVKIYVVEFLACADNYDVHAFVPLGCVDERPHAQFAVLLCDFQLPCTLRHKQRLCVCDLKFVLPDFHAVLLSF